MRLTTPDFLLPSWKSIIAAVLLSPVGFCAAAAPDGGASECADVLARMRADISKDPGRLILALEDALITSEACACEITRLAVDLAGRDPSLTAGIVSAGIRAAPTSAARIAECALMESPQAADLVRKILLKELGDDSALAKSPDKKADLSETVNEDKTETATGKEPKVAASDTQDISDSEQESEADLGDGWPLVGFSGVFMANPARQSPGKELKTETLREKIIYLPVKRQVRRLISPVTTVVPD